jgi:hypothetical protein
VLHPRYKSTYFHKAKWPREWITTAEELFREQWETYYKRTPTLTTSATVSLLLTSNDIAITFVIIQASKTPVNKYFAELAIFGATLPGADPVTEWLSTPPIPSAADPLAYWSSMDAIGHPLARMALDFLSAPGVQYDDIC